MAVAAPIMGAVGVGGEIGGVGNGLANAKSILILRVLGDPASLLPWLAVLPLRFLLRTDCDRVRLSFLTCRVIDRFPELSTPSISPCDFSEE